MKFRHGYVSSSSSTSFIITNKTDRTLTLVDFVKENPKLVEKFKRIYDWYENDDSITQEVMIKDAIKRDEYYSPGENHVIFGDEEGDTIGRVFDYILRESGESENFSWKFDEYLR